MDSTVISLLEKLPYVDGLHNEDEFIAQGSFADFRKKRVLKRSRDPKFSDPEMGKGFEGVNGEYVRPWVLVLTESGNRGSIVYYDTKNGTFTLSSILIPRLWGLRCILIKNRSYHIRRFLWREQRTFLPRPSIPSLRRTISQQEQH